MDRLARILNHGRASASAPGLGAQPTPSSSGAPSGAALSPDFEAGVSETAGRSTTSTLPQPWTPESGPVAEASIDVGGSTVGGSAERRRAEVPCQGSHDDQLAESAQMSSCDRYVAILDDMEGADEGSTVFYTGEATLNSACGAQPAAASHERKANSLSFGL